MDETSRYILAGWLIDGSGGPIQERVLLTISDGRLVALDADVGSTVPDPKVVTDLSHATILPPLVDCHAHLALSATVDPQARKKQLNAAYDEVRNIIACNLRDQYAYGVLAVRDGGDVRGYLRRYTAMDGRRSPVIVRPAGCGYHRAGRYGGMMATALGPDETPAKAFVGGGKAGGHVKLINSGPNSLLTYGRQTPPQFSLAEMRQLVLLAEQHGVQVMVHANGQEPVRTAVQAGCHSIEHGYFMGRDNLALMAEKQIVWVPTLYAMQICAENGADEKVREVARQTLKHQLEQVAQARELGVVVAVGTDGGCPGVNHGESVAREMQLLLQAGYALEETVQCATGNGAGLLGIDSFGLIAPRYPATFLVVPGAPSQLPGNLLRLEEIYVDGVPGRSCRNNPAKHSTK